jgi:hypothetical protein
MAVKGVYIQGHRQEMVAVLHARHMKMIAVLHARHRKMIKMPVRSTGYQV